jgi:hypothetical protein
VGSSAFYRIEFRIDPHDFDQIRLLMWVLLRLRQPRGAQR